MQADGKRQLATSPNPRHGDHPCHRLIPPILPTEAMGELGCRLPLTAMHLRVGLGRWRSFLWELGIVDIGIDARRTRLDVLLENR
jgi:hypothetical protein